MREVRFVEGSLSDLIYDLVLNHVREHPECLDGWLSRESGIIQTAVSIKRGDDNKVVAYVYRDDGLLPSDSDKECVTEQIHESAWDEDE
ncbi:MAG: hypothetical protein WCO51_13105 [bacterium]